LTLEKTARSLGRVAYSLLIHTSEQPGY